MRIIRFIGPAALLLLPGSILSAHAQHPQHGQAATRPAQTQPQPRRSGLWPAPKASRQPQRQPAARPHPSSQSPQQARAWQRQGSWRRQGTWQRHSTWQQHRASHWEGEHRTWPERGGYGGYYIPEDHFRSEFGVEHAFRIRERPTIYSGYPRFQHGGLSFIFVDPWPEYWSDDWYADDDVYIDYEDGYYLYNRRYPTVPIAIAVIL
jgi:hypothetical protein